MSERRKEGQWEEARRGGKRKRDEGDNWNQIQIGWLNTFPLFPSSPTFSSKILQKVFPSFKKKMERGRTLLRDPLNLYRSLTILRKKWGWLFPHSNLTETLDPGRLFLILYSVEKRGLRIWGRESWKSPCSNMATARQDVEFPFELGWTRRTSTWLREEKHLSFWRGHQLQSAGVDEWMLNLSRPNPLELKKKFHRSSLHFRILMRSRGWFEHDFFGWRVGHLLRNVVILSCSRVDRCVRLDLSRPPLLTFRYWPEL